MTEEEKKAKTEADAKAKAEGEAKKPRRVRVVCEGPLGPKLLVKGDETDDPAYVAILDYKGQKKVALIK